MNTTEFSELLKTLLDDIHSRVVEQYSKAEAVRDGTAAALAAMSEHSMLPTWQQTSIAKERMTRKRTSSVCLPEPDGFMIQHASRSGFTNSLICTDTYTLSTADHRCTTPVLAPQDLNGIGRCFTVPDIPRCVSREPRNSFRTNLLSVISGSNRRKSLEFGARWVINPDTIIMQYWFWLNIMALAYVALVSPMQVALMETKLNAMFVINSIVDCFFVVDMILSFFLMYHVQTEHGNKLEYRLSRIVRHYLKTWFLIDLISLFPFDLLALAMESNDVLRAKGVKIARLLRLLKMMRIFKASRIYKRLEMSLLLTNTYKVFDLYKFILYLILISHWLACLWAMTLSLVDDDQGRWVDKFGDMKLGVEEPAWKLYLAALYFTAYTMTSVGYGDVTPVNILERIVCIMILFISGLVWACVIGEVTRIYGNFDAHEQEFRSLMDNLIRMMKDRKLPRPVRKRLTTFFLSARQAQRTEQQEQILRRMSPVLQGEVALMSNWHWVNKVGFICNLVPDTRSSDATRAPHFVVDIALALGSAVFAQSELFGEPRVLYILRQGLAFSRTRRLMRVFCAGDVWGEDFVLSNSLLRECEVRLAVTYVEIFQLTYDNFLRVCQRHSSNLMLRTRLRKFAVRLSAQRAILMEARWRRTAIAAVANGVMSGVECEDGIRRMSL